MPWHFYALTFAFMFLAIAPVFWNEVRFWVCIWWTFSVCVFYVAACLVLVL